MDPVEPARRDTHELRPVVAACRLLLSWLLINWCFNVRWPARTPASLWLAPSADAVLALALIALFGPRYDWAPRRFARVCAVGLIAVRLMRVADGVCQRYLDRQFHVAADLTLVPEFLRLARSTLGSSRFALAVVAFVICVLALFRLLEVSLELLSSKVREPHIGDAYLIVSGVVAMLSALLLPTSSVFANSVAARGVEEVERLLEARGWFDNPTRAAARLTFNQHFSQGQKRLVAAAASLPHAGKPDVHVILIEAYGHTAQSSPIYREALAPAYKAFSETLDRAGFSMCTGFVRATVYGGNSWMTHATLESATPIADQFEYGMLFEKKSIATLAKALGNGGYRTLSVKPGTTRPSPQTRIYGFTREYTAPDFGYRGPNYAWAPMPDQFVLQRFADLELTHSSSPLFVEYALVTSHFPWSPQPRWVDDWSSLGDGSLYQNQPPLRFEEPERGLPAQIVGYANSIAYDLRATSEFIARYVHGDALVLLLGDHQPVGPVAGEASRDTPLHVLSRRSDWLAPFEQHGCVPGVFGDTTHTTYAMEELGPELLRALSTFSSREPVR